MGHLGKRERRGLEWEIEVGGSDLQPVHCSNKGDTSLDHSTLGRLSFLETLVPPPGC